MGLAQRFKEKLNKKDIFEKTQIEKDFETKDIKFISKPITEGYTVQPKELHSGIDCPAKSISGTSTVSIEHNKFENLETEIIDKIRKTPYWEEYSLKRQENMISAYFEKRCKDEYSISEKQEFVENILALANNR